MRAALGWSVLIALLLALLVGALTFDRRGWPGVIGDEAVYLMQAESLAWDFDLRYERQDYDRFVAHWGTKPEGLILQSGDGGKTLTYGKPAVYSLFLAPFVRLSPTRGPFVANALWLALAGGLAARALRGRVGETAPLLVATFLFASAAFANVFWAHSDLFLLGLTAIALSLAYGQQPDRRRPTEIYADETDEAAWRFGLRWALVGGLLTALALSRPLYIPLLVPVLFAVPARRRGLGLAALLGGGALLLGVGVLSSLAVHGSWTSYGGERLGFYSYTGFPEVDLPGGWTAEAARRGGTRGSWISSERIASFRFRPLLTAWNLLYLTAGRDVGLLPYFLPLLLGLFAFRPGNGRWILLGAVLLALAGFLYLMPFNFYGGGAALANRYFLPLYPALWFLAARPVSARAILLVAALSAPFLSPLWLAPRGFPQNPDGSLHHVSALARRFLPYETTQDHLKPSGREDVVHNGLWVKPLGPEVQAAEGGSWFEVGAGKPAELLIGSPTPLSQLTLELGRGTPSSVELHGGRLGEVELTPQGTARYTVTLCGAVARHPMWWSDESYSLYRLTIEVPPETKTAGTAPGRFTFRWLR